MITVTELERSNTALVDATLSYLMRHEATHCLPIGILLPFAQGTSGDSRWWVARQGESIVGVASRTEPFNLILSVMGDDEAIGEIAKVVAGVYPDLPGVIGPKPWSLQFAVQWTALRECPYELELNEMVYECTEVAFPERMTGSARFANERDVPWMIEWIDQFFVDAGMKEMAADTETSIRKKLRTGGYVLWLDEGSQVVSLAGYGNPTPNGMRIGPVYTPAEHRGHGYGVAVSAAVTQHLLDSGRSFVFLFADLDYPVSNHVYRKIGYRPVAEFGVYRFPPHP